MSHTPLPWAVSKPWTPPNGGFSILGPEGENIADVYAAHHPQDQIQHEEGEANARIIVEAVNTRPALLAALGDALYWLEVVVKEEANPDLRDRIRELLK